ncbi:FAD binding domain protein [Aspergillus steynii IBT 23096]|uniref:FAD binding domain protein n=1 Tax=Aspergillus steynii IBT 23096 TaxID=1392250 RepID=A0A2I2G7E8_9EURO|nr:FAD binding domain protein [Aspergillus steynii IBT 23096]PLB48795.1 FAD binding domain protein [Aspergillus steynii IBT 23096]
MVIPPKLAFFLPFAVLPVALWIAARDQNPLPPSCRCFPDDPCWPTQDEWQTFNQSIAGNLIAVDPIGDVCHINGPFGSYDSQACADLLARWSIPATHSETAFSLMAAWWANDSCSPFTSKDSPCTVGPLARYAANVTSADEVRKVLDFTQRRNIRLVIRNTGHDYIGKSTGPGAVALWTHHLKSIDYVSEYVSAAYTGPAMRIGAGVQGFEAQNAAHQHGFTIVTGHCPDIGIAGGYTQGGGHGPLASRYGLAADQVLEWEVVTATGDILTASPVQHADLYWALSGGGGGTYAVVLAMTVRVYPEEPTAVATLSFTSASTADERFWAVIRMYLLDILSLLDTGGTALWLVFPPSLTGGSVMFNAGPMTLPGAGKQELHAHLASTLRILEKHDIAYGKLAHPSLYYSINAFPTYHAAVAETAVNITEMSVGGRLIPRSTVESNPDGLISAIQRIIGYEAAFSGFSMNVHHAHDRLAANNAANPAWQKTAMSAVFGLPFNYTNRQANLNDHKLITNTLIPLLEALTPPGEISGVYLNEADFNQPDWQSAFYGANYDCLQRIKDKYDPDQAFYARTAVGSQRWVEHEDGRLCRAV